MKHIQTSLLTAALSLAAASAYMQAAKSAPAAGASASPSTPPTIASAIDREITIVEKELIDAAEAMPEDKFDFSPGETEPPGQRLQRCAHIWPATEACRCVQLSHLVADNRRETTGHRQRRQRSGQHESQGRNH